MTKLPIIATVKNSFAFINGNFEHAVKIMLPVIAFLIGAEFLMTFIPEPGEGEAISKYVMYLGITLVYFAIYVVAWAALVIMWHRAYLTGVSDTNRVDILNMKREEWQFVGKTLLFGLAFLFIVMALAVLGFVAMGAVGWIIAKVTGVSNILGWGFGISGAVAGFGWGLIMSMRFVLYFPAKATGNYISFRESFRLMKGLSMRLMFIQSIPGLISGIIVSAYIGIITYIFHKDSIHAVLGMMTNPDAVTEQADGTLVYTKEDGTTVPIGEDMVPTLSPEGLMEFILATPGYVFIPVYFALVGVSNLSQTYRWVMENRR